MQIFSKAWFKYEEERRDYALKLIAFDKAWASVMSERKPEDGEAPSKEEILKYFGPVPLRS
jgi:cation transport regulator ChaB